jgi:hypothetical protein
LPHYTSRAPGNKIKGTEHEVESGCEEENAHDHDDDHDLGQDEKENEPEAKTDLETHSEVPLVNVEADQQAKGNHPAPYKQAA